nr:anhydro-N-acetylmuramic acid kinase [Sulfurirhabdus autotrophica]
MESQTYFVGLMSGTSLDGIDAVLVAFSDTASHLIQSVYHPYPEELRQQLLALHTPSDNELHTCAVVSSDLARRYASAVNELLFKCSISAKAVTAIGVHGQTIRHQPDAGYTIQLNNPSLLTELTGITSIADFRSRDIAAGGQGAPLVPAFHAAMFQHPERHRVIVNIGGISNLTNLPLSGNTIGFDCGPGNLLMDAWCLKHAGHPYDKNGDWAKSGVVISELLQKLLSHSFFQQLPPKSAGRENFNLPWLMQFLSGNERPEDVQATLLELTVKSIAEAISKHCSGAEEIYLCGGGARNGTLLSSMQKTLSIQHVAPTDELGVDADWLEAFAFAWLARQTSLGLAGNLPAVTGAKHPCILGAIYPV